MIPVGIVRVAFELLFDVLQTSIQRREVYAYKVGSSGNRSTEHRGLHPGDGRTHLGHLLPQRSG